MVVTVHLYTYARCILIGSEGLVLIYTVYSFQYCSTFNDAPHSLLSLASDARIVCPSTCHSLSVCPLQTQIEKKANMSTVNRLTFITFQGGGTHIIGVRRPPSIVCLSELNIL